MKKIKLLFFLLVVFISGCSVNNIIDPYYSDKPFNFYGLDSSNPNIVAWGRFNKPYFELSVENKSNKPIGITYFLDLFTLFTHDGKEYILEKQDITAYPSANYINPNDEIWLKLILPDNIQENNTKTDVARFGFDAHIILKK